MSSDLDEDALIRSMVFVLRRHPGEWLTFRRLSRLVAISGMDENILAAIAEYRDDLFAISHDRKVKLRQSVLEQTAHQDVTNWVVPARRVIDERRELEEKVARAISGEKSGCYCSMSDSKILTDIIGEHVPDEALILAHCWIRICEVRGPDLTSIPPEVWSELCRRRAVIKRRENPHDF
jgi:hypothetical protein